jgi:hypothetical protein
MSEESIKSLESLEGAIKTLQHELELLNIKTDYVDDQELPALITFDGKFDSTHSSEATDEDIEYVTTKMNRDFRAFTFTYNRLGVITVIAKIH